MRVVLPVVPLTDNKDLANHGRVDTNPCILIP